MQGCDCLRKGGDSRVSGSSRDVLNKSYSLYFTDSGRFLCVNAYFGASIHLILFLVSNHGTQETW